MNLRLLIIGLGLLLANAAIAQDPIKWSFSAKKIKDTKYQVTLTASIQNGWHLYSQTQPENAIAQPTLIEFKKNPLLDIKRGVLKEQGALKKVREQTLGTEAWQFSGEVSFVQVIEVKNRVKTNVAGSVIFQACTEEKCLPPKTIEFSIALTE